MSFVHYPHPEVFVVSAPAVQCWPRLDRIAADHSWWTT